MFAEPQTTGIVRTTSFFKDGKEDVIAKNVAGFLDLDGHIFYAYVRW
jgi:hypothetical protein